MLLYVRCYNVHAPILSLKNTNTSITAAFCPDAMSRHSICTLAHKSAVDPQAINSPSSSRPLTTPSPGFLLLPRAPTNTGPNSPSPTNPPDLPTNPFRLPPAASVTRTWFLGVLSPFGLFFRVCLGGAELKRVTALARLSSSSVIAGNRFAS